MFNACLHYIFKVEFFLQKLSWIEKLFQLIMTPANNYVPK